jgi:hypothetical protein
MQPLHYVTERQVLTALGVQWACPLLAMKSPLELPSVPMLPWPLLHDLRLMPVRFFAARRLLYVAVSLRVEYAALASIEQMLNCQVIPCL